MFSLAIPTYNRPEMTLESFAKVLDNPLISEIVICDDHSELINYAKLWNAVRWMTKVRLFRNQTNLKPLRNKYETVKKCSNDWVILLDSDNIIDNDYIDTLPKLDINQIRNIIYCPKKLISPDAKILWDYSQLNRLVTIESAKQDINIGNFQAFLNTGNYFFNRDEYLKVHEHNEISKELSVNDALYYSYLWLKSGNSMFIVPGLNYIHRVHKGSWYKNNQKECGRATDEIIKLIKQWTG